MPRWSQGLIFHQALVDCARAAILLPLGELTDVTLACIDVLPDLTDVTLACRDV